VSLQWPRGRVRPVSAPAAALVAIVSLLAACSDSDPDPPAASPSPTPTPAPAALSFGVFGPEAEIAAFSDLAETYSATSDVDVDVVSWEDRDEAARAYRGSKPLPDVFMVSQRDLVYVTEHELSQPVDELLDERGVSFGDDYSRDALQAFAQDNSLACMPYSISPMVIYYNTALVDFERMTRRGLDVPNPDDAGVRDSWSFEQFTAAAEFAARPARGSRGVYIEPSLRGFAPFIESGGGRVFNDELTPTSLAFSEDDTLAALETTLPLLRDAQVTPTPQQLAVHTPLELFEEGQLGMIAGFRSLVPELREMGSLNFDVMPMPEITGSDTVGEVTGMCISADTEDVAAAADFLVKVLSEEAVAEVVRQGYVVPANVAVATSDDFLQPGELPANAAVFNASVRDIVVPPQLDSWSQLEKAVAPELRSLVTVPLLDEAILDELTTQIDLDSQAVLDPPDPSESPSPSG
jgi:multiple sugar transport system substrate-binding protein